MKRLLLFATCYFILNAAHSAQSEPPHVTTPPQRIVTEFAVPVAVPVAPLSPIWYGTSPSQFGGTACGQSATPQYGAATSSREQDAWLDRLAEKVAVRLSKESTVTANGTIGDKTAKPSASALFVERCSTCHSGANPKGGMSLDNLATLSAEQRLRSVRSIITEKMPQGGPKLSPAEAGRLIGELVENSKR